MITQDREIHKFTKIGLFTMNLGTPPPPKKKKTYVTLTYYMYLCD